MCVCVCRDECQRVVTISQQKIRLRITKELTSYRDSSDENHVEVPQSFFKAVGTLSFFLTFVVLISSLILRLLLNGCITAFLVVAPVEELHDLGREHNAH